MYRILIADNDRTLLLMMKQVLSEENYDVVTAMSTDDIKRRSDLETFDLFLLDMGLGAADGGLDACRWLRTNPDTETSPIMFLTGQLNADDAVKALEVGGDDYIRKPFAMRELMARIRAHLRRVRVNNDHPVMLRINPETFQVFVDSREVKLTRIEFDLLYFMVNTPGKWHATSDLLAGVWNYPDGVGDTALVRNHIRNLRLKLEIDPDRPSIIETRHGRGYAINAQINLDVAI
jgi:DNA-binding response OmpR family regulator